MATAMLLHLALGTHVLCQFYSLTADISPGNVSFAGRPSVPHMFLRTFTDVYTQYTISNTVPHRFGCRIWAMM
ncbi:hypothetical protein C8J57DRAFT_1415553 [Mycena rebaudengoi]|nr:hypothetical protein C8J57DRAFT_1415553 [Mycena rebaudengoi]